MTLRRAALFAACVSLLSSSRAAPQRLPTTTVPEHYDLRFDIDLANARFAGTTGIDARLTRAASRITLHALELHITSATITAGGQAQQASVTLDEEAQTATLTLSR